MIYLAWTSTFASHADRVLKIAIQGHADVRGSERGIENEGPMWRAGVAGGERGMKRTSHKERGDRGREREVVRGRVSRYSIGQKSIQGRPG